MKKNGFTIIELIGCLALLGIILLLGIHAYRGQTATALSRLRVVSKNEVFAAAEIYVMENNVSFTRSGHTCVRVRDLIDYGYLKDTNDEEVRNKSVKISRNNLTKVIDDVKYVDKCN